MDFNERVIPGVTANFQFKESLARYEFVFKHLKDGIRILDIGCGTGYGSDLLSKKFEVVALDKNVEAILFAKKHYPNGAKFLVGDATDLSFKSESFDCVCSFEVIEHIKDVCKMLSEVKRILKKGGKFVMSTPRKKDRSSVRSPYHLREYSEFELRDLLKKYFRKVEILGQVKSARANAAFRQFLRSQKVREKMVSKDVFGIRKLFTRNFKEKIWSVVGDFFGRRNQEYLNTSDFPIKAGNLDKAEFLVAICVK